MKRIRLIGVFVCPFVLPGVFAYAQAQRPALKINLGAWELSTNLDVASASVDTSKMTPEQKARVEAMMRARANGGAITRKSCVTQEDYNKGNFLDEDPAGMKCTRTITTNTATVFEATRTCTGDNGSRSEHVRIEATSPASLTMKSTVAGTRGGRPINANVVMNAKWLGADCTGIK